MIDFAHAAAPAARPRPELGAAPNAQSWLAFWWAIETVTTVGYGDVVPHQTTGKVLAAFLMLGGLSMLAILTATITSSFVAYRQEQIRASAEDPVATKLDELGNRLETMEGELRQLRAASAPEDAAGP